MDARKIIGLVLVALLTLGVGFIAFNGMAWGIYEIRPLLEQIPQGLDLTGGVAVVYEASDLSSDTLDRDMAAAETIMRQRLDGEGYTEATINGQGQGRLRIEIPINESNMVEDPAQITQYLVKPAKVEFFDPDGAYIFSGGDIEDVYPGINPNPSKTGQYAVHFKLKKDAAAAFALATALSAETGKPLTIKLDGEAISTATASEAILGGEAFIESPEYKELEKAQRLANQIRSGALPMEMNEIEVRSVSASLGEEALQRGLLAGMIGLALVFVFMIAYYRVPGLIANLALMIYILLVFYCLATIPGVQLTLPGIAGIILSIGMAVDANVIIFERMREEIHAGKSVRTSVKMGFERAFSAIMDSNITTIIAALVLLFFGTGSIKGFATTLLIGIVVSFITAVFITRGLLYLTLGFHFKNKAWFAPLKKDAEAKQ